MSDVLDLSVLAKRHVPSDPGVAKCWGLVVKGIEVGWLDLEELRDLLEHLQAHRDFGVEELLFAHLGDVLRVSFLDDQATCSPSAMIEALVKISPVEDDNVDG